MEAAITADAIEATEIYTTTIFTETVPATTTVVTAVAAGAIKRQAASNPPKCMTNGVTYPSSRITSACSCINVPASTVSVTHVVSTDTVTEVRQTYAYTNKRILTLRLQTNTIVTTPHATVTSWETVSTATTSGTFTVTVLPTAVNRLVNGDFETGDSTGWELSPESWKGEVWKSSYSTSPWMYIVNGAEGSLATLRQVKPVYLEAGSYEIGLYAPPARYPLNSAYWEEVVTFELTNSAQKTTITPKFGGGKAAAAFGRIVIQLRATFDVPVSGEGYYDIGLKFLTQPLVGTNLGYSGLDEFYLKRV